MKYQLSKWPYSCFPKVLEFYFFPLLVSLKFLLQPLEMIFIQMCQVLWEQFCCSCMYTKTAWNRSQCCPILHVFWGVGFLTSLVWGKTVVPLSILGGVCVCVCVCVCVREGGAVIPPQCSLGVKRWKILAILYS